MSKEVKKLCDSCIFDARRQALDISTMLNESKVSTWQIGKDEILRDAEDIFQWLMKGSN